MGADMGLAHSTRQAQAAHMRREWLHTLLLLAVVAILLLSGSAFAAAREVKGFVLSVSDLDRSVAFFEQALGFRKIAERTTAERVPGAR